MKYTCKTCGKKLDGKPVGDDCWNCQEGEGMKVKHTDENGKVTHWDLEPKTYEFRVAENTPEGVALRSLEIFRSAMSWVRSRPMDDNDEFVLQEFQDMLHRVETICAWQKHTRIHEKENN